MDRIGLPTLAYITGIIFMLPNLMDRDFIVPNGLLVLCSKSFGKTQYGVSMMLNGRTTKKIPRQVKLPWDFILSIDEEIMMLDKVMVDLHKDHSVRLFDTCEPTNSNHL